MITNIKTFIAEKAKNPGAFKYITENFEDDDMPAVVDNEDDDNDDDDNDKNEEFTFDVFKDAYTLKLNELNEESENDEELDVLEMPTDEQLQIAFDVFQNVSHTIDNVEIDDDMSYETEMDDDMSDETEMDDDMEPLEEGLGDFFRGGSKEEIEEKKKNSISRLKEIEAKFKGKNLVFQEYGDNKTIPYTMENALKTIAKNNYLGTIETFDKGDKIILLYKEGKKGMNKLATGTTAQTVGA
jgi:hypothetical protein